MKKIICVAVISIISLLICLIVTCICIIERKLTVSFIQVYFISFAIGVLSAHHLIAMICNDVTKLAT